MPAIATTETFNAEAQIKYKHTLIAELAGYIAAGAKDDGTRQAYSIVAPFTRFFGEQDIQDVLLAAIDRIEPLNLEHASYIAGYIQKNASDDFRKKAEAKWRDLEQKKIAAPLKPPAVVAKERFVDPMPPKVRLLYEAFERLRNAYPETERADMETFVIAAAQAAYVHNPKETLQEFSEKMSSSITGYTRRPVLLSAYYGFLDGYFAKDRQLVLGYLIRLSEIEEMQAMRDPASRADLRIIGKLREWAVTDPKEAFKTILEYLGSESRLRGDGRKKASQILFDPGLKLADMFAALEPGQQLDHLHDMKWYIAGMEEPSKTRLTTIVRACATALPEDPPPTPVSKGLPSPGAYRSERKLEAWAIAFSASHADQDAREIMKFARESRISFLEGHASRSPILLDVIERAGDDISRLAQDVWFEEVQTHPGFKKPEDLIAFMDRQLRIMNGGNHKISPGFQERCAGIWHDAMIGLGPAAAFAKASGMVNDNYHGNIRPLIENVILEVIPKLPQKTPAQFLAESGMVPQR